jgi:adenylate kinase
MNLILLGPPGGGKGTQARLLAEAYGPIHIATGDMFRAAIAARTPLGREVQPLLAVGDPVPDEVTVQLVRQRIAQEGQRGFLLDGFPRTVNQAAALDGILTDLSQPLDAVILLQLEDAVAVERLLHRAKTQGRPDDALEVVQHRLRMYHAHVPALVDFYLHRVLIFPVDAAQSVRNVFAAIQDGLVPRPRD